MQVTSTRAILSGDKPPSIPKKHIEPLTVSVRKAEELSGFGHTMIAQFIKDGRLKSTKVGGKRLINFASLKALVGAE